MGSDYAAPGFFPPFARTDITAFSRRGEHALQPFEPASGEAKSNPQDGHERGPSRALVWVGVGLSIAGLGAAVAYAVAKAMIGSRRLPDDPTSQRIRDLIDEANALLKTLDDQKHSA